MKKLIFFFCFGCSALLPSYDSTIGKMEKPIIIIAESKDGDITLRDGRNRYLTIPAEYHTAKTLSESFNAGDTISIK